MKQNNILTNKIDVNKIDLALKKVKKDDGLVRLERANNKLTLLVDRMNTPNPTISEAFIKIRMASAADTLSYIYSVYDQDIPTRLLPMIQQIMLNLVKIENLRSERNFKKMEKMYRTFEEKINLEINEANNKNEQTNESLMKLKQKTNSLVDKMESIWATILNVIITYTIATAAIGCLTNVAEKDVRLIPIFVIGIVFLGITCISFSSLVFKKDEKSDMNIVSAMRIYYVTLALFIITLIATFIWI